MTDSHLYVYLLYYKALHLLIFMFDSQHLIGSFHLLLPETSREQTDPRPGPYPSDTAVRTVVSTGIEAPPPPPAALLPVTLRQPPRFPALAGRPVRMLRAGN